MANPYVIKIELPSNGKKSAVAGNGNKSTGTNENNSSDKSMDAVTKKLKQMVSFAAVKSTADTIISYKVNQVALRTGAIEYEQRLSYIYSAVSQTVGAGAALIGAGLTTGPGGVAVVALGLAASATNKLIGILQKSETLQLQESLENISIGMYRVRAGTSGRRDKTQ